MNYDPYPEPRDDESDAEFRERYRGWFDRHCNTNDTPGFRRRQWIESLSFIGIQDAGDDFTPADSRPLGYPAS
jgi:hypothetical protein